MIRTLVAGFAVTSLLCLASCGGSSSGDSKQTGGGFFVLAGFQLVDSLGSNANCAIENNGAYINDATVTIGGETIPFGGVDGVYQKLSMTGTFATGDTVTLSIQSSAGSATASGKIPAAGASANSVPVTGAAAGSVFNISH